jgi:A/G-specific adenine glycosylase
VSGSADAAGSATARPAAGTATFATSAGRSTAWTAAAATTATPPTASLLALRAKILDWYAANGRDLPWRCTTDPYAILVSEVMLQQTQVSRVLPKYESFLTRFPSLEALAAAPLADVLALWQGLGYNSRAVRLQRCAQATVTAAGGAAARLPGSVDELRRLPGVGPYTARAVLIFAHNADLAAVDANVRRVLTHELGLPEDMPASELQAVADAALPIGRSRAWHNALMDYGAAVLTSRVTGIAPLTRQSRFQGSHRMYRARAVRLLLEGERTLAELAGLLGLPAGEVVMIAAELERDGLAARDGDRLRVP